MSKPYRNCIVAVVGRRDGRYLIGERRNQLNSWQFPQGGVEEGEDPIKAAFRELHEETGTQEVQLIRHSDEWIPYDFPADLNSSITKKYRGQTQMWFLFELLPNADVDIALSDGEFVRFDWQPLEYIVEAVVAWKQQSYIQGLRALQLRS